MMIAHKDPLIMAGCVLLAITSFLLAVALFLALPFKQSGNRHASLITPQSTVTVVDSAESSR